MKITVAETYDAFCKAGRGAIIPVFRGAGDSHVLAHYIRRCPDCDRESSIPINDSNGKNYGFSVQGNPFEVESLTLFGELYCPDCGWQGSIRKGEYIKSPE